MVQIVKVFTANSPSAMEHMIADYQVAHPTATIKQLDLDVQQGSKELVVALLVEE